MVLQVELWLCPSVLSDAFVFGPYYPLLLHLYRHLSLFRNSNKNPAIVLAVKTTLLFSFCSPLCDPL